MSGLLMFGSKFSGLISAIKLFALPMVFLIAVLYFWLYKSDQITSGLSTEITSASPLQPLNEPGAFKQSVTTLFWIGEEANADNGYISNKRSHWDNEWVSSYGGVDDPRRRKGFSPASFRPKENSFYVALPFADTNENNVFKETAKEIVPDSKGRLTKNRWVEIRLDGKSCFGQWEDVGPFGEDDFAWVFGQATKPRNSNGEKAGLDVSPALAACLGLDGLGKTEWRLVNEGNVPDGPWKDVITER
jgi:hypothetical protein